MKRYLFSAALILSTLLVSCSQEGMESDGASNQIIAKTSTLETKTSVGSPVEGTNAVGINWTDGDQIGVFDAAGTAQKCYAKVGTGTAPTAAFAVVSGSTAFASPVYAYYPYSSGNNGKAMTALTGNLPATQSADGKLHGDYKIGRLVNTTSSGNEFEFAHLFSLARFSIDVTGTYLDGEKLTSVKLSATRGGSPLAIAGDFTFDVRNGSWEQSGNGSNTITLSWAQGLTLNQPVTCYMNLFPTLRVGDQITIELVTANHTARVTSACKANFIKENIYNFPLAINEYSQLVILDDEGNACYGTFTCAALNVDGLPSLINPEGPGTSGTTTLGQIANNVGWDFFAVSEDFEYHSQLSSALTNYNMGTYRGSIDVATLVRPADTDGLEFFWKKDAISATGETMVEFTVKKGDITHGANESIKKGFRHYVVTVAQGVVVDVYITHMNTYEGEGNTEETNEYVRAVLSQLRQMRDYVLANAMTNNRPAIIMGDSNMRYTRHKISENFIDYINNNVSGSYAGYTVVDPWVKCNRNNVYPTWNTPSLMIRSKFAGWEGDIVACDDQRGEVVDKMWYINVPTSPVQIEALSCENDVAHFTKSTEDVTYSGVQAEDAAGNVVPSSTISYTKKTGYADHFPVVAKFRYTRTQ